MKNARNNNDLNELFNQLLVIDKLEVGLPRISRNKVSVPYTIIKGNEKDTTDFIYKFEENVFDPTKPSTINLASLMGAQIAFNYGLFCKKIVFNGIFDAHDKKFIKDMIENTSREIFVMKILQDNPFLKNLSINIKKVNKGQLFTQSKIIFNTTGKCDEKDTWSVNRSKYCVLSSGGKDSLLSFSLLNELDADVYPFFVNESGRHWFTALNGYRYFNQHFEKTERVWTNSDRVFSWMLRKLTFIRQDFAQIRSDEYPIRLWTVAIFIFSVLPLIKKYGIGRIVVGNEFDTTRKCNFHGIPHYDGLYDQSRYFDNMLTRYYKQKNWQMSQFSLVRPLSELLIEKILIERYPEIQKQQVSCHATHVKDEKVLPCGKCEKCRRIISMIIALGKDPQNCGYTLEQIEACKKDIVKKGIHQEKQGIEHLFYLLQKKHLISPHKKGKKHPEILQLRFDEEQSPTNTIPLDIRRDLFTILLHHANGAVIKNGKMWLPINPLSDARFSNPYPYEGPVSKNEKNISSTSSKNKHHTIFSHLTWPEAKKILKEVDLALIPVGAIEQHGPHLPLDTDAFDAEYLAKQVANACSDPKPIVLPLIPYGVSYHHDDFSGTISISPDTLAKIIYEIGLNLARQGITKIIIINGHGGNTPALKFAAQLINRDANIFTTVETGETSDTDINSLIETVGDVHSGEIETSTALATRPHLVHMDHAKEYIPDFSNRYLDFSSKKSVEWYARTAKISPNGTLGNPTKASIEKGQKIWEIMIKNLTEFIEHIKSMSLEEIYQRRY